jgi:AAHS family 4-hydroxybenzoate transporter-like MFS transporter
MAGSFLAAGMIPKWGWQSIFLVGGVLPLFLLPILWWMRADDILTPAKVRNASLPVSDLFSGRAMLDTILLWLTSFTIWTMLIVTAFWTPPLMRIAGFTTAQSAETLAFNNIGAVIGTLALGSLLGRVRPHQLLLVTLPASAVLLVLFGWQAQSGVAAFFGLLVLSTIVGFFASAAAGAILGLSADVYPSAIRATGIGWTLGFGRIGSIVGPLVVAALVTAKLPVSSIYTAIGFTAAIGTLLIAILSLRLRNSQQKAMTQ